MAVPTFRDLDGNSAIRLSCLYSKFLSSDSCRLSQNSRSDTAGPNPRGKTFTPPAGVTDASFRRALLKLFNLKLSEFHAALPSQALEKAKETGGSAPPLDFPLVQPQPAQPGSMLEHVIPRGRWNPTRRSARQPETVPVKPSSRQAANSPFPQPWKYSHVIEQSTPPKASPGHGDILPPMTSPS